jgi:hypothetical protein
MILYRTNSLQFFGVDLISVLPASLPLPILRERLSDFLEDDTPLLEISMKIAEKETIHVGGGWLLFHKRGIKENYQWRILELLYQPKVLCTMHYANSCGFPRLLFL